MPIYLCKPQTLGEGLKRVVTKAGNGRAGNLQSIARDGKNVVRHYTNGVNIASSSETAIGYGTQLRAFISSFTDAKDKCFQKIGGWVNGKQKIITKQIDINGHHVPEIKASGKNILKNYSNMFGNTLDLHVKYAKDTLKHCMTFFKK